eukprot:TRINITY_DN8694_c0_g1_i1.p1 TRINITY_DN8694_c0_g1~~TRINITY_DN8694_c0_g1_i1.p1  ORF type:complete len:1695 (-),score=299.25 TRINITY_DN8694_c0_g1_i1:22-4836(-)
MTINLGSERVQVMRGSWLMKTPDGQYVPFSDDESTRISEAWRQKHFNFSFSLDSETLINFDAMEVEHFENGKQNTSKLVRNFPSIADKYSTALMESGEAWEEILVNHINFSGDLIYTSQTQNDVDLSQRKIAYFEFIDILRSLKKKKFTGKRCFIYQPELFVPDILYSRYGLSKSNITFSNCYPDFLEVFFTGNTLKIRVIDAKASLKVKFSHKIQVALYAIFLRDIFISEDLEYCDIDSTGGVWLRPELDYYQFNIHPIVDVLESFLSKKSIGSLKQLVSTEFGSENWNLSKKCCNCDFFDICHSQAMKENDITLIKGISGSLKEYAMVHLRSLDTDSEENSVYDIEDSYKILNSYFSDNEELAGGQHVESVQDIENTPTKMKNILDRVTIPSSPISPSLKNYSEYPSSLGTPGLKKWKGRMIKRKNNDDPEIESQRYEMWKIKRKIEAFTKGVPMSYYFGISNMYKVVDVEIFISVIYDQPTDLIFSWNIGVNVNKKSIVKKIPDITEQINLKNIFYNDNQILFYDTLIENRDLEISLIETLYLILNYFNEEAISRKTKTNLPIVQCYVFQSHEIYSLKAVLRKYEKNGNPDTMAMSLSLVSTLFDTADNADLSRKPFLYSGGINLLLSLQSIIDTACAVPVMYNANIEEYSSVFFEKCDNISTYSIISRIYENDKTIDENELFQLLYQRNIALFGILHGFRDWICQISPLHLSNKGRYFSFRNFIPLRNNYLSKIAYLLEYELFVQSRNNSISKGYILTSSYDSSFIHGKLYILSLNRDISLPKKLLQPVDSVVKKLSFVGDEGIEFDHLSGTPGKEPVTFYIKNVSMDFVVSEDSLKVWNWLLVKIDLNGTSDILSYQDFYQKNAWSPRRNTTYFFARIDSVFENTLEVVISTKKPYHEILDTNCFYYLTNRTVDLLSKWVLIDLTEIDMCLYFKEIFRDYYKNDILDLALLDMLQEIASINGTTPSKKIQKFRIPEEYSSTVSQIFNGTVFSAMEDNEGLYLEPHWKYEKKNVFKALFKSINELKEISNTTDLFMKLITDPISWGREPPADVETAIISRSLQLLDKIKGGLLTDHQCSVFENTLSKHLQLIWGPPGSGKTHFLSMLMMLFSESHRTVGKVMEDPLPNIETFGDTGVGSECKILIIAFTHAAIDNLILKLIELQNVYRDKYGESTYIPIARLMKPDSQSLLNYVDSQFPLMLNPATPKPMKFYKQHRQCIIGGTVWGIRKAFQNYFNDPPQFNMVIVDEASQLLLANSFYPIQYLNPDYGRLVLAGDHHQLPPIINGEYPKVPTGTPLITSSIFHSLLHADIHGECLNMLNENWRMNKDICAFSGESIYNYGDSTYSPANDIIANGKFPVTLANGLYTIDVPSAPQFPISNPLLELYSNSNFGLSVVVIKNDIQSLNKYPHSCLISCLVKYTHYITSLIHHEIEDEEFWKDKMMVVAPHHTQRESVRRELVQNSSLFSEWSPDPVICESGILTVEKAQGREVENVIVDYGLTNSFAIANEMNFIYSRNRLNVAITRAKHNCIVFIGEPLLEQVHDVFTDPEPEEGYVYLRSLVEYAEEKNSLMEINKSDIPSVVKELEHDFDILIKSTRT